MFIISKEYVIFLEELIIASNVLALPLLETELHETERVHGTPFQELSLSRDFKSKTKQKN